MHPEGLPIHTSRRTLVTRLSLLRAQVQALLLPAFAVPFAGGEDWCLNQLYVSAFPQLHLQALRVWGVGCGKEGVDMLLRAALLLQEGALLLRLGLLPAILALQPIEFLLLLLQCLLPLDERSPLALEHVLPALLTKLLLHLLLGLLLRHDLGQGHSGIHLHLFGRRRHLSALLLDQRRGLELALGIHANEIHTFAKGDPPVLVGVHPVHHVLGGCLTDVARDTCLKEGSKNILLGDRLVGQALLVDLHEKLLDLCLVHCLERLTRDLLEERDRHLCLLRLLLIFCLRRRGFCKHVLEVLLVGLEGLRSLAQPLLDLLVVALVGNAVLLCIHGTVARRGELLNLLEQSCFLRMLLLEHSRFLSMHHCLEGGAAHAGQERHDDDGLHGVWRLKIENLLRLSMERDRFTEKVTRIL